MFTNTYSYHAEFAKHLKFPLEETLILIAIHKIKELAFLHLVVVKTFGTCFPQMSAAATLYRTVMSLAELGDCISANTIFIIQYYH